MKQLTYILENYKDVLTFLRSKFPLYHQSNFFFRDVQYGIQSLLERKGMKTGYTDAEMIAREFVQKLEKERIFLPVDRQTWVVNYPEYRKPVVKPVPASAKPAGSAPAAPRPATSAPASKPPAAPASGTVAPKVSGGSAE